MKLWETHTSCHLHAHRLSSPRSQVLNPHTHSLTHPQICPLSTKDKNSPAAPSHAWDNYVPGIMSAQRALLAEITEEYWSHLGHLFVSRDLNREDGSRIKGRKVTEVWVGGFQTYHFFRVYPVSRQGKPKPNWCRLEIVQREKLILLSEEMEGRCVMRASQQLHTGIAWVKRPI